jgi:hypothetical protein
MVTCRDTVAPMTWRSQGSICWQHGCWRAIGVALVSGNAGGTQVSDAGLVYVARMSKLSELNVDGTEVTKSGMKSLQETLRV